MKNKIRITTILMTLILLISFSATITASANANNPNIEVIIGFTNENQAKQAITNSRGTVTYTFTIIQALVATIPQNAITALEKNPNIQYIERNHEVYALEQTVPWGIDRVFGDEEYSFENGFETWELSTGADIKVAVLDTGIDTKHEDLPEVSGGVRFYTQAIWLRQDNKYEDDHGHGTHVAGTIAALDNDLGVVGVAPDVSLYAVKVLDARGSGSVAGIVAGIEWSVKEGMDIISMSLGSSSYSQSMEDACNAAYAEGVLLVAAAGNSGNSDGTGDNVGYPAKYEKVIAVAATDSDDKRAYFSSTGPAVELSAPGVDIYSTIPGNNYRTYSGTSMACPHVTGVAALVWAANTDLTNTQVREILQQTAQDLELLATHQGYGLVRADAAVALAKQAEPPEYRELTILAASNGNTNPVPGVYVYSLGSDASVFAIPQAGYELDYWLLDTENAGSANPIVITMVENHELQAVFVEVEYTLTVNSVGNGWVDWEPEDTYRYGDEVDLRAIPEGGYVFVGWSDDFTGTNPEITIVITDNMKVTATFAKLRTLDIAVIGEGSTSPEAGSYQYAQGTNVDVTALPNIGYELSHWLLDDEPVGDANPFSVTMDDDKTLTAVFIEKAVQEGTLTVDSITYSTTGGRLNNQHLIITIAVSDDAGAAVTGASVSIAVYRDGGFFASATGTSGTDGTVIFRYNNAPSGTYRTIVEVVIADGLIWDGEYPENEFEK